MEGNRVVLGEITKIALGGCFVFEIAGRNYAKALRFAIWANENLQACTDPFVPRTK